MACRPRWFDDILEADYIVGRPSDDPCDLEGSRAEASRFFGVDLPMNVYAMARMVASEAGEGPPAERLAVAEANINRWRISKKRWPTLLDMLAPDGCFAKQSGEHPPVSTRLSPTWGDVVAARAAFSSDFTRGATHFFGHRYLDDPIGTYRRWTTSYKLRWVGPLPGVRSKEQMFFAPGVNTLPGELEIQSPTEWDFSYPCSRVGATLAAGGFGVAVASMILGRKV